MTFARQAERNLAARARQHVPGGPVYIDGTPESAQARFEALFDHVPKIDARHCPRHCTHSQEGADQS